MTGMTHPLRGTCVPGCEMYGVCHCGCGKQTQRSRYSHTQTSRVRGQPSVFVVGHFIQPRFPADPVLPFLGTWDERSFGERWAAHFGTSPVSAARLFTRIRCPGHWLKPLTADCLAVFLDSHIEALWPEETRKWDEWLESHVGSLT